MIRESKPPISSNVDDGMVELESDHDASCLNKRPVHDICSAAATDETNKSKALCCPVLKLVYNH